MATAVRGAAEVTAAMPARAAPAVPPVLEALEAMGSDPGTAATAAPLGMLVQEALDCRPEMVAPLTWANREVRAAGVVSGASVAPAVGHWDPATAATEAPEVLEEPAVPEVTAVPVDTSAVSAAASAAMAALADTAGLEAPPWAQATVATEVRAAMEEQLETAERAAPA